MEGGGWWGATKWWVRAEISNFQGEMAHKEAPLHSAKSMAYTINHSCGGFQQGGCLYKPTSGIQWTPEHSWTDRPQKQASAKADLSTFGSGVFSLLMELSIQCVKMMI